MLLKAIQKGFYLKIRNVGAKFSMDVDECPSWCVELDNGKSKKASTDMKATEAIAFIKTIDSLEDLHLFAGKDKRKSVEEEVQLRTEELED